MADPNERATIDFDVPFLAKPTEEDVQAGFELRNLQRDLAFQEPRTEVRSAEDQEKLDLRPELPPRFRYSDLTPLKSETNFEVVGYDTLTHTPVHQPYMTKKEERIFEDPGTTPAYKHRIMSAQMMEGSLMKEAMDDIETDTLWDKIVNPTLGILYEGLQPLEVPRAMAWKGASFSAQILPNADAYLGDMAGTAFAKLYPSMQRHGELLSTPAKHIWYGGMEAQQKRKEVELGIVGKEPAKEDVDAFNQQLEVMGKNIYSRLAQGDLYDKFTQVDDEGSLQHKFDHTYFATKILPYMGVEIGAYRGRDLIDGLMTKEESGRLAELALRAGDDEAYATYTMLQDDSFREGAGLVIECVFDPLNLLTGGTHKVVTVGGKVVNVSADVSRAIDAVVDSGKVARPEANRIVVSAMEGSTEDIAKLTEMVNYHKTEMNAAAEEVTELTAKMDDPAAAVDAVQADIARTRTDLTQALDEALALTEPTPAMLAAKGGNRTQALSQMKADKARFARQLQEELAYYSSQAEKMQDAKKAKRYLQNEVSRVGGTATYHRTQIGALSRVMDESFDISKGVQARGTINLNLPYKKMPLAIGSSREFKITPISGDDLVSISERTGVNASDLAKLNDVSEDVLNTMITSGERVTVGIGGGGIKGLVPDPIIRIGQKVSNPLQPVNLKNLMARRANADSTLTRGEKLALMIGEGVGEIMYNWTGVALHLWDFTARLLGTRFYQPMAAHRRTEQALEYYRVRGANMNKIRQMMGGASTIVRLQKSAPKIWDAYQDAYGDYLRSVSQGMEKSRSQVERLARIAKEISDTRLAKDPVKFKGTSGQSVLDEAAGYMEMGRRFPVELQPLINDIVQLQKQIQVESGKDLERIKQALGNIARFVQGDLERVRELSSELQRLQRHIDAKRARAVSKVDDVADEIQEGLINEKKTLGKVKAKTKREAQRLSVLQKKVDDGEKLTRAQMTQYNKLKNPREVKQRKELIEMHRQATQRIRDRQAEIRAAIAKYKDALKTGRAGVRLLESFKDDPFVGAMNRSLESFDMALDKVAKKQKELEVASPKIVADRIEVAPGESYSRALVDWENDLFERFEDISEGYSREDVLMAVMATFKRSEPLTKEGYRNLVEEFTGSPMLRGVTEKSEFPAVIGERFRDVPEDIEPLVEELSYILECYGEAYRKHGMDFVKNPEDLMTIFGVMEHVPHLKLEKEKFNIKVTGEARLEQMMTGEMDAILSGDLAMDAGRYRGLVGTMDEINALAKTKGDDWNFTLSPELMHARFLNSTKGMASKELFLTFLRTGVIRQFDNVEEARQAAYVPVMGQRRYGKDLQVLILGSQDELIAAGGKTADGTMYSELLEKLEEGSKIESTLSTWARDLGDIGNTLKVEKFVGTVRALQAEAVRGLDPALNELLIKDGMLDIKTMHRERAAANHAAYLDKKQTELQTLIEKQERLFEKGKPLSAADQDRYERLIKVLDTDTPEYEVIMKRFQNQAWNEVSDEVNILISDILNKASEIPRGSNIDDIVNIIPNIRAGLSPLTPKDLKMYFGEQSLPKMYLPESIEESFRMLSAKTIADEGFGVVPMRLIRSANNFWKTRITIPFIMFHTRNAVGNMMSNLLDLGVGGVFNLNTQIQAQSIAHLVDYHTVYGSIRKAVDELGAPRKVTEKGADGLARFLRRKQQSAFLSDKLINKGKPFDLGDGVQRTLDEALDLLTSRGVISGSSNFRLDYDHMQEFLFDTAAAMSKEETIGSANWKIKAREQIRKASKGLSLAEDVVTVSASGILAGFPIAMPKGMGAVLARRLENHSRMVNFIGTVKRGGSVDDAVRNVEKFLFNYNDLTPWQRDYMRHLVPFFTWTQKNVVLQLQMIKENPAFYARFMRTVYHTLPMITQIEDRKAAGIEEPVTFKGMMQRTVNRVQYYPEYKMYRVRIGMNAVRYLTGQEPTEAMIGVEAEGLGLPIESFAEHIGMVDQALSRKLEDPEGAILDPVMARTHWIAKAAYVAVTERDPFYGETLNQQKMRNANEIANVLFALSPKKEIIAPDGTVDLVVDESMVGRGSDKYMQQMRVHISETFGVQQSANGRYYFVPETEYAIAEPHNIMKYYPNTLARAIREGALLQDFNNLATLTREAYQTELIPQPHPWHLRALNATTGIKLKKQADTEYLSSQAYRQLGEAQQARYEELGLTGTGKKIYIKK
jgi:LysM repeat protein